MLDCDDYDTSAIYEEISTLTRTTPPPILRNDILSLTNDILSYWEDDTSPPPLLLVPRPKVGWTNRRVTFVGKISSIRLITGWEGPVPSAKTRVPKQECGNVIPYIYRAGPFRHYQFVRLLIFGSVVWVLGSS